MQKGHCLCEQVQYEFDETRGSFGLHCHCKDCQRVTARKSDRHLVPS